jgi:hypothetical protein
MLAFQAALSFAAWTGIEVPGEEFLATARQVLAGRGPGRGIRARQGSIHFINYA